MRKVKKNIVVMLIAILVAANAYADSATIISNYGDNYIPKENVAKIPVEQNIYDIGYVVYSKEFADRYGYNYDYVVPMDKGMHMLEFRMRTEGIYTACYFNVALDNSLPIRKPAETFFRSPTTSHLPAKREELKDPKGLRGYYESPEERSFRMPNETAQERYNGNYSLATMDYKFNERGINNSMRLISFDKRVYRNLDYYTFLVGCGINTLRVLNHSDPALWFIKYGTRQRNTDLENSIHFRLADKFTNKITELMKLSDSDTRLLIIEKQLKEELK